MWQYCTWREITIINKYLGNVIMGKYLGVIVGNEKSSHCEESNHCPGGYKERSAMWQKGSNGCSIMHSGYGWSTAHIFKPHFLGRTVQSDRRPEDGQQEWWREPHMGERVAESNSQGRMEPQQALGWMLPFVSCQDGLCLKQRRKEGPWIKSGTIPFRYKRNDFIIRAITHAIE